MPGLATQFPGIPIVAGVREGRVRHDPGHPFQHAGDARLGPLPGRQQSERKAFPLCGAATVEVATPINAPILLVALDRTSLYLRAIRTEIV